MNNILKLFLCGFMAIAVVPVYADDDALSDTVTVSGVTARMDCKTLKSKIDELSQNGASDELSRLQLQYRKDCVVRASGLRSSYRGGALTVASISKNSVSDAKTNAMASVASAKVTPVAQPENTETVTVEISDEQRQMCERLPDVIAALSESGDNTDSDNKDALQLTYDEYCKANVAAPESVVKLTMFVLGPADTESESQATETDEEKYARIAANLDAGLCPDGETPNKFGCCGDEKFKEISNLEFACCPETGECFPPIK